MNTQRGGEQKIGCRQARRLFRVLGAPDTDVSPADRLAGERHLESCSGCAREYRVFLLGRAALDAAAAPEAIEPGEEFYTSLRARILRGPEADDALHPQPELDESWAAALTLTARQLIPAMAMLLILIIGATLLLEKKSSYGIEGIGRPTDRVILGDVYEYPRPTEDDVLETLVAVEEKQNGRQSDQ